MFKKIQLHQLRYILEIIAFPFFSYLVFNFALSGSEKILEISSVSPHLHESGAVVLGILFLVFLPGYGRYQ